MKRIAIAVFVLALAPMQAKAFTTQNAYSNNDLLSYVAMPIAVSSVCDVRGVQTDRVGELVGYMNQAEVAPADFVDVFRYVPVALVMRTDRRPDFVEWVHGQVGQGVVGVTLVTSMEHQLGTYSDYLPVSSRYRGTRHQRHYAYAYRDAFADDYVPVVVHRYCERQFADPLALIEMPLAVTSVYDLGLPYQRVSSLAIELNLGDVPPLQFVEMFRYAPAALVVNAGYGPDFVEFVHSEQVAGIGGIALVQVIDQRLPTWGIDAQFDLSTPYYYSQNSYYAPQYAPAMVQYAAPQYYVPPVDPTYIPPVVQTRVASAVAAGGANWSTSQQAPAIAATPQVQRLLNTPNGGAVVMSPGQARRELERQNRAAREAPVMASGQYSGAPVMGGGNRGHGRGAAVMANPALPPQAIAARTNHGNGHGNGKGRQVVTSTPAPVMARPAHGNGNGHGNGHGRQVMTTAPAPVMAAPAHGNGNGNGHGRGHAAAAAPPVFAQPQPQPQVHGQGNGHGHGQGHERQVVFQPPAAAPPVMAAPAAVEHGRGHGNGGGPPVAVAPAPAPAPVMAAPQGNGHQPPGQEKKKGKGHE